MDGGIAGLFSMAKKFGLEVLGFYYSNYPGYVIDREDPLNQNRLKISVPSLLAGNSALLWAYAKGQACGKDWGAQALPQEGDMVWVSFMNGRLKNPMWEPYYPLKGQKPTEFINENYYGFKTPKGNIIVIKDEDESEITVRHKDGTEITMDKEGIYLSSSAVINISNGKTKLQITEDGINIDSDSGIYIGGNKQVLYAKLPDSTEILDVSQIGVSKKIKVG